MSTPASQFPAAQTDRTPLRFVTAASLFDGHDAAINIMRRLIQGEGAEQILAPPRPGCGRRAT
ncbi:hypothetical protein [Pseudoxanthomonas mexicana]